MMQFVPCCEAAGGKAEYGYLVDEDAPPPRHAGPIIDPPLPERKFVPSLGTCLHEAAHAYHLHARGYRIARAQVGRRNFIERAPGEGARMASLEQIEAALAGEVGGNYAAGRQIRRMLDDEIDAALARVATGKHGSCDPCIAGVFTRHIARAADDPNDPVLLREIWRVAEADVTALLTSRSAYRAIKSLGDRLRNENEMTGEAVHRTLEPYMAFGSHITTEQE